MRLIISGSTGCLAQARYDFGLQSASYSHKLQLVAARSKPCALWKTPTPYPGARFVVSRMSRACRVELLRAIFTH